MKVDKEKLIRAMEYCTGDIVPVDENDECLGDVCPFKEGGYESGDCQENMIRATLALLKEQDEGIEPEISLKSVTETTASLWYKCGACGEAIEQGDDKFCRHCGRKVKWND